MQQLIHIESRPAVLSVNFEDLQAALSRELEKYKVVVTADTIKDAKALATELNATKKLIADRRKEEVAKASEPVKQFDSRMKQLEQMCETGRQDILQQVQRFEDEVRDRARALLRELRDELWGLHGIEAEFRRAEYDDLVMLTAVTATGNLAASARNKLEARVSEDKALQDRTSMRLLALENASYKAGLSAPLTRDHVAGFLMADEATYSEELDRIINAEIVREEQAQQRMRDKLERERAQQEQAEKARLEREEIRAKAEAAHQTRLQERQGTPEPSTHAEPAASTASQSAQDAAPFEPAAPAVSPTPAAGTIACRVICAFDLNVPAGLSAEAIEAELRKVLVGAGIDTLAGVQIRFAEESA